MSVTVLFPSLPFAPSTPDPDYEAEYRAAQGAGFSCVLFELEALRAGNAQAALRRCHPAATTGELLIYRGWMMCDAHYALLHKGLLEKGYRPITDPAAYVEAHYLPLAYKHLEGITPETFWIEGRDAQAAWGLYSELCKTPLIVKDFVKSAKHRWREACFLPAETSREDFDRILDNFLTERGSLFEKGIVFRRFHALVQLGEDMRGMPIHEEYRLFCLDGQVIAHAPFYNPLDFERHKGDWGAIAQRFNNRFITLDVARQADGSWIVIEAGDGGVSGLPLSIEPEVFYPALWSALQRVSIQAPARPWS